MKIRLPNSAAAIIATLVIASTGALSADPEGLRMASAHRALLRECCESRHRPLRSRGCHPRRGRDMGHAVERRNRAELTPGRRRAAPSSTTDGTRCSSGTTRTVAPSRRPTRGTRGHRSSIPTSCSGDAAFTFFSGTAGCSGGFYIEDVVAHEFGHALGLGHSADSTATMYASASYCSQSFRVLASDELAGIEAIYPAVATTPPTAPSELAATISTDNPASAVDIAWADGSTDEDRFLIERALAGAGHRWPVSAPTSPRTPIKACKVARPTATACAPRTRPAFQAMPDLHRPRHTHRFRQPPRRRRRLRPVRQG